MQPPLTDEPIVRRRTLVIGAAILGGAVAAWIVGDLLIVTDEERLEDFSDAVTGTIEHDRVQQALRYFDPSRVPLTIEVQGSTVRYGREDAGKLQQDARSRLAPYNGLQVSLLGRTIEVTGQGAHVVLHTFSRRGRNTIDVDLRKQGDDWLVSYLKIT